MLGRMASLFVTNEALSVPDVLRFLTGREVDLINVHCVWIGTGSSASRQDIAISSSSEFPESYHIAIEFASFIEPLFPFPTSLSVREGSGSHHDSELLGYSLLECVYEDAAIIDPTACLGQFEGCGVLVKVSIELVHVEGIHSLVGAILQILRDEGFFEGFAQLFESFL